MQLTTYAILKPSKLISLPGVWLDCQQVVAISEKKKITRKIMGKAKEITNVCVRINYELYENFKKKAKNDGRSIQWLIERFIKKYILDGKSE